MNNNVDLAKLIEVARKRSSDDAAHDFSHVQRVLQNARLILRETKADPDIVLAAVALHELFNYPKGHPESSKSGDVCAQMASEVLVTQGFPEDKLPLVLTCIRFHSFSRGIVPDFIEAKIVQDADRLDAIGAIGIARCFATTAQMGRPFYNLSDPFGTARTLNDKEYGLDHFYVKLLRLADGMHTQTGRRIAEQRTLFMERYLEQFRLEIGWRNPTEE